MAKKIAYWASTAIACLALFGSLSYLTGSEQVVAGFAKAGYPQHLRIVLGIAKPIAAIVLLLPGFALLKEWAYAGVTFALVMATISGYLSGEGAKDVILPLVILAAVFARYVSGRLGTIIEFTQQLAEGNFRARLPDLALRPDGVASRLVDMPEIGGRHDAAVAVSGAHQEPVGLQTVEAEGAMRAVRLAQSIGEIDRGAGGERRLEVVGQHPLPAHLARRRSAARHGVVSLAGRRTSL